MTGYLDQVVFAILINDVNEKIKPKKIEDQMIRLFYFLNRDLQSNPQPNPQPNTQPNTP
jgi:hypothetical protein